MPREVKTTPFGRFLDERGLAIKDLPLPVRNYARTLRQRRTDAAPNSPIVAKLAEHLKVPVEEIAKFAEGEPLTDRWRRKIQTQLDRGTIPRGKQLNRTYEKKKPVVLGSVYVRGGRKKRAHHEDHESTELKGYVKTPLAKLAREKGFSIQDIANRLGVPHNYMWRVSTCEIAKNHPVLDPIAKLLDVDVGVLKRMMRKAPLNQGYFARAQRDLLRHMEGKGRKRGQSEAELEGVKPHTAVVKAESNGDALAEMRSYNRLGSKRAALALRNSTRAMIATLNVSVMRGDTHMPPIPVGDLYLVLQDYLLEKGVKRIVLVDPAFPTLFDPKN